ncbi:MAG TPA: chemotaxis protein CheA, partial [Desulfuromonadales bacterium]|nr:chemotaxis protein CheA [Desulfuromonadales bacterium]
MNDFHGEAFFEEAQELLSSLESSLLELEKAPQDQDLIDRVFRALHTVKGSGAMFGFDSISDFTHHVESVFDRVRNAEILVDKDLITLTLAAGDHVKALLEEIRGGVPVEQSTATELTERFKLYLSQDEGGEQASSDFHFDENPKKTFRIRFKPHRGIFLRGVNPLGLLREIREMGECCIVAQTDLIPSLEELDPEACLLYWDIILTTEQSYEDIHDVFIFVEDDSEIRIDIIDEEGWVVGDEDHKKLGDILVDRGELPENELETFLKSKKRLGETLIEAGVVNTGQIDSALAEQQHLNRVRQERSRTKGESTIRVRSGKLDSLVNLVGELVTMQARLSQLATDREDDDLLSVAEQVEHLTWEMRDEILNIRMVPIGTTFSNFNRLVRDLSQELEKDVELVTRGAETELDKTVIERLNDPLVHIIRNCIDHGIEKPEVRKKADKPPKGTVTLSAIHSGANVVVEIHDDGQGLDRDHIRRRSVEMGLASADAEISDKELTASIMAPGFSTADSVTSVSGRGVGMDVVKQAIDDLRGSIEISSQRGKGTTFSIKLPLTLAIIDGLLVEIADERFVFPLSAVEECVELKRSDISGEKGRDLANVRGELIPYIRLRNHFDILSAPPEIEQVVIAHVEGQQIGFVVDQVVGEHQTVIKSLGRLYHEVSGLSGATILGDGTIALILDLQHLFRTAENQERQAFAQNGIAARPN